MRTKFIGLLVLLAVIVGGWTYAWTRVRDDVMANVDAGIADLAAQRIVVICPDRTVSGWPFRVSVACREPEVQFPDGSRLTAGALDSNGAIDDPELIVTRFAAPILVVASDGTEVEATFSEMTTSYRPPSGEAAFPQIAAAAKDLAINAVFKPEGLDLGRLTAAAAEMHVRPSSQPADVDLAVTLTGGEGLVAAREVLPAPADAGLLVTLRQALLLDGTPEGARAWSAAGGDVGLTQAALEILGARLEVTGHGGLDRSGRLTGTATVSATGLEGLSGAAASGKPLPPALAALATALTLMGKPVEADPKARALEIRAENGAVTANGLPIGEAPALF